MRRALQISADQSSTVQGLICMTDMEDEFAVREVYSSGTKLVENFQTL
jgi:hypothetical protein